MATRSDRTKTKHCKARQTQEELPFVDLHYMPKPARVAIAALNDTQKRYASAIKSSDLIFAVGPAGTGKTFMPTALAAEALMDRHIDKVIISRPAVDAGESLGFLPGELEDKYEPYLAPVRQIFLERMGSGAFEYALKAGRIEPIPIGFMRGMTFKNCWVIIDEAQNITPKQMKMILTRFGDDCKMIICGDSDQCDLGDGITGLDDAIARLHKAPGVRSIEFSEDDCVRSGMARHILRAYSQ